MKRVENLKSSSISNSPAIFSMQKGKLPPQAVDLEEVVLGAMMIDKKGVDEVIDILQPDAFYKESHKIIFNSIGQISASSLLLASGSFVVDPDNLSRFGQDGFQSFVMVENTGVIMQTSNFNLNTARFIISSSDVGVMAVGSTPPLNFNNGKGFYVDGDGNFLVGDSAGPRIQFDGFQTTISSSNFFNL